MKSKIIFLLFLLIFSVNAKSQQYDSSIEKSTKWRNISDKSDSCLDPIAGFSYMRLDCTDPIINFESTAMYADSIIWKALSKKSLSDTIIGIGNNIFSINLYDFVVLMTDCMEPPCPNFVDVTQVVYNSCGVDSITISIQIESYTSIDFSTTNSFKCYPIPSAGIVNITGDKVVKTEVFDITGRSQGQYYGKQIDLSSLPAGIYILNVYGKEGLLKKEKIILSK